MAAAQCAGEAVYVEACEHYQKQSWRNRFRYLSPDGPADLNFPVVHENGTFSLPIRAIRVDWSTPWAVRTKRSLEAAYGSSAFFEYYRDGLFDIYDSRPETLWELNSRLTLWLLGKLGIPATILETAEWCPPGSDEYGEDLREAIHPKRPNSILRDLGLGKPYFQVFSGKYGFTDNLSVVDLLFNEGPNALSYIRSAIRG